MYDHIHDFSTGVCATRYCTECGIPESEHGADRDDRDRITDAATARAYAREWNGTSGSGVDDDDWRALALALGRAPERGERADFYRDLAALEHPVNL